MLQCLRVLIVFFSCPGRKEGERVPEATSEERLQLLPEADFSSEIDFSTERPFLFFLLRGRPLFFRKTAFPEVFDPWFSAGLWANAKAEAWGVLLDIGSTEATSFPPLA